MAFVRDSVGNPQRDADGNVKTTITEAQSRAKALYDTRKEQKAERLRQREEARSKRTPQQQLERLDMLLGKDLGAAKERARLNRLINQTLTK